MIKLQFGLSVANLRVPPVHSRTGHCREYKTSMIPRRVIIDIKSQQLINKPNLVLKRSSKCLQDPLAILPCMVIFWFREKIRNHLAKLVSAVSHRLDQAGPVVPDLVILGAFGGKRTCPFELLSQVQFQLGHYKSSELPTLRKSSTIIFGPLSTKLCNGLHNAPIYYQSVSEYHPIQL